MKRQKILVVVIAVALLCSFGTIAYSHDDEHPWIKGLILWRLRNDINDNKMRIDELERHINILVGNYDLSGNWSTGNVTLDDGTDININYEFAGNEFVLMFEVNSDIAYATKGNYIQDGNILVTYGIDVWDGQEWMPHEEVDEFHAKIINVFTDTYTAIGDFNRDNIFDGSNILQDGAFWDFGSDIKFTLNSQ
jgi:hypothetical protein